MPAIMNCLDKDNACTVGGNTFSFKSGQMKYFHSKGIASIISRLKGEDGFIELPESMEYLAQLKEDDFKKVVTPEQKELIEEKRKEGINNYCRKLRSLIYNATVSLQKDIDRSGAKYDARTEANDADLRHLEELAKYQTQKQDLEQQKVDRFKDLEKQVKPRG